MIPIKATLLFSNAFAILNEERFLKKCKFTNKANPKFAQTWLPSPTKFALQLHCIELH